MAGGRARPSSCITISQDPFLGIAASRSHPASGSYGRIGAIIYAVLVVMAFIDPTTFGLVPIGSHDIWLHAGLAAGLAYIRFATRETAWLTRRHRGTEIPSSLCLCVSV